jgi:hypothetical protein
MTELVPVERCCASHQDWAELTDHLTARFPQVGEDKVAELVAAAQRAEQHFGLPIAEHLATAEIIVRHELLQLTGQIADNSRLDPETHVRPRRPSD